MESCLKHPFFTASSCPECPVKADPVRDSLNVLESLRAAHKYLWVDDQDRQFRTALTTLAAAARPTAKADLQVTGSEGSAFRL